MSFPYFYKIFVSGFRKFTKDNSLCRLVCDNCLELTCTNINTIYPLENHNYE